MNLELATQLRMAKVASARGRQLRVLLDDVEHDATLALGYSYEAATGDTVLTIAQDEQVYVIGVIEGRGLSKFVVPGDLEFKARRVKFSARDSIELDSERVRLRAGVLEFTAETVIEKCKNAWHWVRESLSLKAGRVHTAVEGEHVLKAERIEAKAKKAVRIDGQKINLG